MAEPKSAATPPANSRANVRAWAGWLIAGALIGTIVSVVLVRSWNNQPTSTPTKRPVNQPIEEQIITVPAPLTGRPVPVDVPSRRAWAVVVENFPSVRPQSGLAFADLVFEAPTEGGITRMLAFFQSQLPPSNIGPIRSARPYFNDWASTFRAFFSHSGGTSEALQQLKGGYGELTDINEFYNGDAYERLDDRKAPHNLFTSAERFWNYLIARDLPRTSNVPSLAFRTPSSPGTAALGVTVPYYPTEYRVRYDWRQQDQSYLRAVGGNTQYDATTQLPLRVTNAIIMVTDITPIPKDPLLKVNLRTLGTGTAILFSRGERYDGTWSKADLASPLTFTGSDGQPLPLAPGNTWVSVIDQGLLKSLVVE